MPKALIFLILVFIPPAYWFPEAPATRQTDCEPSLTAAAIVTIFMKQPITLPLFSSALSWSVRGWLSFLLVFPPTLWSYYFCIRYLSGRLIGLRYPRLVLAFSYRSPFEGFRTVIALSSARILPTPAPGFVDRFLGLNLALFICF